MRTNILRSLKVNCLLAVFIPVTLAAAACIAFGHWQQQTQRQEDVANADKALRAYVAGMGYATAASIDSMPCAGFNQINAH